MNYNDLYSKLRQKMMLLILFNDRDGVSDIINETNKDDNITMDEVSKYFLALQPDEKHQFLKYNCRYPYPKYEGYNSIREDLKDLIQLFYESNEYIEDPVFTISAKEGKEIFNPIDNAINELDTIMSIDEDEIMKDINQPWIEFFEEVDKKISEKVKSEGIELELAIDLNKDNNMFKTLAELSDRYVLIVTVDMYNPSVNAIFEYDEKLLIEINVDSKDFDFYKENTWNNDNTSINIYSIEK